MTLKLDASSAQFLVQVMRKIVNDGGCVCSPQWAYPDRRCDVCAAWEVLTVFDPEAARTQRWIEKEGA